MKLETNRTYLRPWTILDAAQLYEIAKNENIGPAAGWPAHKNVEESKEVIETVLANPKTFAICLKEGDKLIGSIGFNGYPSYSEVTKDNTEAEIGYWLSEEFWGLGLMPEVAKMLLKYLFEQKNIKKVYANYYEGNDKSKRTIEKCGFEFEYIIKNKEIKLLNKITNLYVNSITYESFNS